MKIQPFKLERYFAKYEFCTPHLLCSSDCQPLTLNEVLALADENSFQLWDNLSLGYTEPQGNSILIDEIAKLYSTIQPESVLVAAPEEGIYISMNSILAKNDHVIATFPGYQSLYEIAESIGCNVEKWTPEISDSQWKFDVNKLKTLITDKTKLIAINFPHNPTGAFLNNNEIAEIVNLARKNNIFIFSDEMYRYSEFDEKDRVNSIADIYENGVSLCGMSKSFAMPGVRIGWITSKNKQLFENLQSYKDYTTICNNAPGEILSIIALRNKEKIIERNQKIIFNNLALLESFFNKWKNILEWYNIKAGTMCFPKLKLKENILDFCTDLINKKGVMLLPATVYDFEGNYFRLGFGRENLPAAIEHFDQYLSDRQF